jgi:hypothetical protein
MRAFTSGYRWAVAVAASIGFSALLVPFVAITPAQADGTFEFRSDTTPSEGRSKRTSSGSRKASKRTTSNKRAARQTSRRFSQNVARSKRMSLGAVDTRQTRESLTGGSKHFSRKSPSRKMRAGYRRSGVSTASLGNSYVPRTEISRSLTGGGIRWGANSSCLNSSLRSVLAQVASTFGPVTVNSTCRSRRHNARVGGARHSHHLSGNAVDFRVHGASGRAVYSFLRSLGSVGGLKLYRRGFFHIDTGARRTW